MTRWQNTLETQSYLATDEFLFERYLLTRSTSTVLGNIDTSFFTTNSSCFNVKSYLSLVLINDLGGDLL